MAADISFVAYFAPIAAFLIVTAVTFAVLLKTKVLGEHKVGLMVLSFIIAALFVSAGGAITYVKTIVPWFAVLLVSLFFLLLVTGFVGKPIEFANKGIGLAFLIILGLVFLISGYVIFSDIISPYLPGPGFGTGENVQATAALDWLYSPRIAGAILLVLISAAVAWVLVKAK